MLLLNLRINKAQLPIVSNKNSSGKSSQGSRRNQSLSRKRSLYWGTHQMLFQYSHNQGLKYDKTGGDSLIKINQRSISNDVTNLIEEILNAPNPQADNPNFVSKYSSGGKAKSVQQAVEVEISEADVDHISGNSTAAANEHSGTNPAEFNLINELNQAESEEFLNELNTSADKNQIVNANNPNLFASSEAMSTSSENKSNEQIEIKDCCIYLNRLDDLMIDDYLNKFESKYNSANSDYMIGNEIADEVNEEVVEEAVEQEPISMSLNELPCENELYSDEFRVNLNKFVTSSNSSNNNSGNNGGSGANSMGIQLMDDDEELDDEEDERTLLEKNCLSLNENELNENDEDFYTCELCDANTNNHSYKHLTQLKVDFILNIIFLREFVFVIQSSTTFLI